MIRATIVSASKAIIDFDSEEELRNLEKNASYRKKSAEFLYRRHMNNRRWAAYDPTAWRLHGEALKRDIDHSVLFSEDGKTCIRPGYLPYIEKELDISVTNLIEYPKPRPYPYQNPPKLTPYPYQTESVERLIREKHGNVELCTGAGKTYTLLMIAQKLGLKTVVMTPSVSIFLEILKTFEHHFGKNSVGALGGGKKRFGKNFTVCVSDSVSNLKPGTDEYNEIASAKVLLADESHTIPAATLERACHGVLSDIPYRFFFSGTQTRGDGTEKMLHAIIGKTVYSLSTQEAIAGGYISDHEYRIVPVSSSSLVKSDDALAMKRAHFLKNDQIANFIAKLATSVYELRNEKTLVLVDEIEQINMLKQILKVPHMCATGDKKHDDPEEAVEKFNKGEIACLIGTSCISTGTNIYPTHHTVNWQGGTSEIKTKQGAIGRSVRKLDISKYAQFHPEKKKTYIYDFDVRGVPVMERHLKTRIKFYKDSGTMIKWIGDQPKTQHEEDTSNEEE